MKFPMMKSLLALVVVVAGVALAMLFLREDKETLNVYNWSDYIAEDTIALFEAETGIEVVYDVYDSNEVLEAKVLAGDSGYDVVVPTADFLARGFEAGAYQKLDLARLRNLGNQDAEIQARANSVLGSTDSGLVYMWGTTGIAYNEAMVAERLGDSAPTDSWDLIFDAQYAAQLADCGVVVLDAPTDILPNIINYTGKNGRSVEASDFESAGEFLASVRPHLRYIHSSQSLNDIANGDICAAVMWSGDAFQAAARAEEADNGHTINYYIPKEGTNLWFDMFAIPADAENVDNAYRFIDFMLRADIAASNVNYVWYASGNRVARSQGIEQEILDHPGIYPSAETEKQLFVVPVYDAELDRVVTRVWSRFNAG